jgi:hypothetical protein
VKLADVARRDALAHGDGIDRKIVPADVLDDVGLE